MFALQLWQRATYSPVLPVDSSVQDVPTVNQGQIDRGYGRSSFPAPRQAVEKNRTTRDFGLTLPAAPNILVFLATANETSAASALPVTTLLP
jgi:hypothetical protein